MPRFLAAAALLSALVVPSASAQLHYLVATSTSSNISAPSSATSVLFYDRRSLTLLDALAFPTRAIPVSASPDGRTVYLAILGDNPGLATVHIATLTVTPILSLPGVTSIQRAGPTHLLARTAD